MKVRYFILKQKNPYSQIYVRFWNGRIYDSKTSTGLKVLYNDWSSKSEAVKLKTTSPTKDFVNGKLMDLRKHLIDSYNVEYNSGMSIGKDWLKTKVGQFFNRVDESKPELTYFVDWIKLFIETAPKRLYKGKPVSQSTLKKYTTTLNTLTQYEAEKSKRLRFEDITMSFYFDFVDFCRNTLKHSTNTIGTYIKKIKFFCGQIDLEGLPISNHYKNSEFMSITEQSEDIYLTTGEIGKIFNYDFSDTPYLDNARDLLIIGINTGLRISDFMRLDLSHIKADTIRIKAQKTGKIAEIPINEQIERTLIKNGGKLPRSISEQKFNEYLKEIGKKVGFTEIVKGAKMDCINVEEAKANGVKRLFRKVSGTFPKYELMTSHICRRSFATNLYGHIPTPVIMSITGHATETQFLTYIKKTTAENAEVLRNFYKQSAKENGLEFNLKAI
ncbi:tyrosine-type recombinase/integrase [Epilithonimonas sp.]|uniref:tyrosine-type recombinase/integrase n=1 Tax=Epilithonimonas sp. TaxID=2894511 RepID=UPI0028970212|nr:tyrosine-type recombinase/integrase [Epilithonimonas sp.]